MLRTLPARVLEHARKNLIPAYVLWTLTYKCNLLCSHCYQHLHRSEDLSTDEVFRVMDELQQMGALHLTLSGGEPMARKDFWEILAAAVQRRFAVTIFSNGTLIDEARAEQLATFPLAGVEVSLHGADAAVHDRIVGKPGAYVRTLRAIEALDARGLHVTVKMSLMKQNVDDARILERRFENAKNITLKVSPRLFPRDDGDSEPCDMHLDEDQELAYHRRRLAEAPQGLPSDKIKLKVLSFDPATAEPCGAGRTLAVILPNGDVLPCPMLHHVKMGNVREKPFSSIWLDSDEVRELRALTLSKWEECRGCPFISVCNHCPAISMAETGKMHGWSSQVCQSTKTFWTAVREKYRAEGREPPI